MFEMLSEMTAQRGARREDRVRVHFLQLLGEIAGGRQAQGFRSKSRIVGRIGDDAPAGRDEILWPAWRTSRAYFGDRGE